MNWLVSTSLRLRVLVLALSIVLMIVGVRTAQQAPLDVFPEFAPPLIEIQTEAPGLSTEEVESLISVPAGERAQRHDRAEDDPVEVGARAVVGRPDPQGGDRPDGVAAGRAGAAVGRGAAAAGRGAGRR